MPLGQEARLGKVLYEQSLQQLRDTAPEAYLLHQQAHAAEVRGDMQVAIELYHSAMQQTPDNSFLLTSLGLAYLRIEDTIPARRYLLKAVNVDPGYYKPRLGLGYIYLQNQQYQQAVTQLEESLQQLATVEAAFLLGQVKEAQEDLTKARELYLAVVQADRDGKLGTAAASRLRSLPR
ncbi:tetratricopeptide repeat protein [Desulfuromusa kysingii]|uniref:tetratricopeptide repeat protein n=1 Tax=Desulfuromusa kysingii TaxID=37625 RepID=UPI001FDF5EE2|nr:tetratricopeptide repeat protein [Desulfuromusa kysingii]